MIEMFAVSALAQQLNSQKAKEDQRLMEFSDLQPEMKPTNLRVLSLVAGVIALAISLLTARLAFLNNVKSGPVQQTLLTLIGFFFSGFYLLWYLVRYVLFSRV